MTIPRYLFQLTKQCLPTQNVLKNNFKQSYCELHHRYSTVTKQRKYTERHEWIVVENNIGTVGVSNYAQESLGDVVFAQLPDPGTKVEEGDECGALESVKAASDIFSPVSGTVTEKNKDVEKKPGLINSSCYDKGWLFRLKLSKLEELEDLMTEESYEKFLKMDADKEH